jgi:flagellar FliL protein
MAMAETTDLNEPKTESGARHWLLPAVGLLVLLSIGAGSWIFYNQYLHPSRQDTVEAAPEVPIPPQIPVLVALDPFLVNLADPAGKRYLRTVFDVEVNSAPAAEEMKAKTSHLRDSILMVLSGKSFDDIRTVSGKGTLRDEIVNELNKTLTSGKARNVYFKEFVVQ